MFNFIVLQKLAVQTDQVPVSGGEKVKGSLISKRYRENWWTSKETPVLRFEEKMAAVITDANILGN